ncbi:MAG: MATE family efflux transporter [Granulosicoccus sp.]|nr:MATE family efflux transporter [Granulosicoccus sp.]
MTSSQHAATYTTGSVFGHLSNLALTSAIGMFAIMIVDLVDMYFISILGQPALAAAVGFAGLGLFFGASICIGISVATSTLVAQSLGENDELRARRYTIHGFVYSLIWTLPVTALTLVLAPQIMSLIGAEGETLQLATRYFRIVGASLPVLGISFVAISILRSVGAAKMSMWATIAGGLVNAVLDPLFIFGFGLGLDGAAIASVISRFTVMGMALYSVIKIHNLITQPHWSEFREDCKSLNILALPSILTNLSAPVSSAYATAQMAQFGTDAVAAAAVVGRLTPVAFCGLYGLSGAVGPVASQNVGAQQFQRVRQTLLASGKFVLLYVIPVTLIMFFSKSWLVEIFNLQGDAADLLHFYCTFIVISYILFGLQLSANPLFTALRHPGVATVSNMVRDIVLAIPLIFIFSSLFEAKGVLAGQALANAIAGILWFSVALWMSKRAEKKGSVNFNLGFVTRIRWLRLKMHHHNHVIPGVQQRGH